MFLNPIQQIEVLASMIHCNPLLGYGTIKEQVHKFAVKFGWDEMTEGNAYQQIGAYLWSHVDDDLVIGSFYP